MLPLPPPLLLFAFGGGGALGGDVLPFFWVETRPSCARDCMFRRPTPEASSRRRWMEERALLAIFCEMLSTSWFGFLCLMPWQQPLKLLWQRLLSFDASFLAHLREPKRKRNRRNLKKVEHG